MSFSTFYGPRLDAAPALQAFPADPSADLAHLALKLRSLVLGGHT